MLFFLSLFLFFSLSVPFACFYGGLRRMSMAFFHASYLSYVYVFIALMVSVRMHGVAFVLPCTTWRTTWLVWSELEACTQCSLSSLWILEIINLASGLYTTYFNTDSPILPSRAYVLRNPSQSPQMPARSLHVLLDSSPQRMKQYVPSRHPKFYTRPLLSARGLRNRILATRRVYLVEWDLSW